MSRFIVTVTSTQTYNQEWEVEAESAEEAEEIYYDGTLNDEMFIDTMDEYVNEVTEISDE